MYRRSLITSHYIAQTDDTTEEKKTLNINTGPSYWNWSWKRKNERKKSIQTHKYTYICHKSNAMNGLSNKFIVFLWLMYRIETKNAQKVPFRVSSSNNTVQEEEEEVGDVRPVLLRERERERIRTPENLGRHERTVQYSKPQRRWPENNV